MLSFGLRTAVGKVLSAFTLSKVVPMSVSCKGLIVKTVMCHGVVDSSCDTEFGGTGGIPSHDTKVNSAFHPFKVDK